MLAIDRGLTPPGKARIKPRRRPLAAAADRDEIGLV